MTNIIKFPSSRVLERIVARNNLAALVNSSVCKDEMSLKLVKLIEAMDKHNHKLIKMESNMSKETNDKSAVEVVVVKLSELKKILSHAEKTAKSQ